MDKTPKIHPFYGGPFSQWAACAFTIDGIEYSCAEKYMMAAKASLFGDDEALAAIMESDSPREQKAWGRKVKGFNPDVWNAVAKDVVFRANMAKFTQNRDMWKYMVLTGNDILVEASPTDRVWGVGISEDDPRIYNQDEWQGTNWLGEVLMEVREAIRFWWCTFVTDMKIVQAALNSTDGCGCKNEACFCEMASKGEVQV